MKLRRSALSSFAGRIGLRIPSAKAVRDTAVEERDGKIIKSRRQHVCGREYIVFAEFSFGGTQSTVDLMKQVIDLEQDAKNISA